MTFKENLENTIFHEAVIDKIDVDTIDIQITALNKDDLDKLNKRILIDVRQYKL